MRNGKRTGLPVSVNIFHGQRWGPRADVSMASVVFRTGMERSVHNLLCFPEFRSHSRDLALLVRDHQLLCLFEAIFAGK